MLSWKSSLSLKTWDQGEFLYCFLAGQQRWLTLTMILMRMTDGFEDDVLILNTGSASCYNTSTFSQIPGHWWWWGRKTGYCRTLFFLCVCIVSGKSLSVFRASAWWGSLDWQRPASFGSHRIPCPITGRRGLKRGHITLSQQTTGNRKTESAASRRSSQPSTISHGLIRLHLHLLHQNGSFRAGLVCPGFKCRWVYADITVSKC